MKLHIKTIIKAAVILFAAGTVYYFWKVAPVSVPVFEVKSSPVQQTVYGTGTLSKLLGGRQAPVDRSSWQKRGKVR